MQKKFIWTLWKTLLNLILQLKTGEQKYLVEDFFPNIKDRVFVLFLLLIFFIKQQNKIFSRRPRPLMFALCGLCIFTDNTL